MTLMEYIDASWVLYIGAIMCFVYAYMLLVKKDIDKVRLHGDKIKQKALPKQKRVPYAIANGKILLGAGIGFLLCAIIRYFDMTVSYIVLVIVLLVFMYFWKITYDKYE